MVNRLCGDIRKTDGFYVNKRTKFVVIFLLLSSSSISSLSPSINDQVIDHFDY